MPDSVKAVAFAPDGSLLRAGLANSALMAFPPTGRRSRWEERAHPNGVRSVLVHPDGQWAFTAGWDKEVCRWSLRRPERTRLVAPLAEAVSAAALSPDGRVLAVGLCHSPKVHLIDPDQRRMHDTLMSDEGSVFTLAFAPDGSLLAAGDTRGRVLLWPPTDPTRPQTLEGHAGVVYGLGFTPDGRRLVSAGADRRARVWDVSTGRVVHEYQWQPELGDVPGCRPRRADRGHRRGGRGDRPVGPAGVGRSSFSHFDGPPPGRPRLIWNGPARRGGPDSRPASSASSFVGRPRPGARS